MILMLVDLETQPKPESEILRAAYGLTPSENAVAQLLAEGSPADLIAQKLEIRLSSVRQVIKALLFKTGTHRQSELVALIGRIPNLTINPS